MSQLRKLRRHLRPRVAIDLETAPLRPISAVDWFDLKRRALRDLHISEYAPGGLSAETIARRTNLSREQAEALVEAYRSTGPFAGYFSPTGRAPSRPEMQRLKPSEDAAAELAKRIYDAEDIEVTVGGVRCPGVAEVEP